MWDAGSPRELKPELEGLVPLVNHDVTQKQLSQEDP